MDPQATYSTTIQTQALTLRMDGCKYTAISEELGIPENTLKKWFAPSVNRHNLSIIKDEQIQELSETSKKLLNANIVSITEKLTEMALEGDMRAIIEVMDRVHGTPLKQVQKPQEVEYPIALVTFIDAKDVIEPLEALRGQNQ